MAKDLPYFKFFCSEWADGDITLEDFDTQGLFINICAYYWSNECLVEHSKLLKKFKNYDLSISSLINSKIIKLKDNYISISFLDEQFEERDKLSKQNSKNIKNYWEKKRALNERNTTVSNPLNESDSIKRREEEIREEKIIKDNFKEKTASEIFWIDAVGKDLDILHKTVLLFLDNFDNALTISKKQHKSIEEYQKHFSNWLKKQNLEIHKITKPIPKDHYIDKDGKLRKVIS